MLKLVAGMLDCCLLKACYKLNLLLMLQLLSDLERAYEGHAHGKGNLRLSWFYEDYLVGWCNQAFEVNIGEFSISSRCVF